MTGLYGSSDGGATGRRQRLAEVLALHRQQVYGYAGKRGGGQVLNSHLLRLLVEVLVEGRGRVGFEPPEKPEAVPAGELFEERTDGGGKGTNAQELEDVAHGHTMPRGRTWGAVYKFLHGIHRVLGPQSFSAARR